ncbi:MAG: DUF2784 domain-containing protein [Nitrospiria bacterium]
MFYRILADLVVLVHLAFVLFAVLGGFLVLRGRRWAWLHIPALLWAAWIEFGGWVCPLTPLENWLRESGGTAGYRGDFIERYLLPILYPAILTRRLQVALGLFLIGINAGIYIWVMRRAARK